MHRASTKPSAAPAPSSGTRSAMRSAGSTAIATATRSARTATRWSNESSEALDAFEEAQQQPGDRFGLLLLHPVPCPVDQVHAGHPAAGAGLHRLEVAGLLVDAPVSGGGAVG